MAHNQQPRTNGKTDRNEAIFLGRVIRVRNRDAERIAKDRRRFGKSNFVLAEVFSGLVLIPFEFHGTSLPVWTRAFQHDVRSSLAG